MLDQFNGLPEVFNILGPAVLAFEVISVFPKIQSQKWLEFVVHDGRVLHGQILDDQFGIGGVAQEPSPPGAK